MFVCSFFAAALSNVPILLVQVVFRTFSVSVSLSSELWKTANWIWMPFGVVVWVGPRICSVDRGADRPTVRVN